MRLRSQLRALAPFVGIFVVWAAGLHRMHHVPTWAENNLIADAELLGIGIALAAITLRQTR